MSKSLAIITYDIPHLKTVQVMEELLKHYPHQDIAVFGLPFRPFKPRDVLFEHRPNQFQTSESGKSIADKYGIKEDFYKTILAVHVMMAWVGAGRCLGFDYYFFKRRRGIWW